MKNRNITILLTILALIIFVTACSSATTSTTPAATSSLDGATLLQERCSVCHPLSFVERSRFSAADWKTVVDVMISRGAQLTPEEKTVLVSYLATNFGR